MLLSNSFGLGLVLILRSYNPDLAEATPVWATSHFARHYSGNLG